jgi:choline dehydrogenase-like flavoprotein
LKIIDATTLNYTQEISTEVCIIGTGIAGSILAVELSSEFDQITLIESGNTAPDFQLQSLNDVEHIGIPFRKNFYNRIRQYGGACNIWPGRTMVMSQTDFNNRPWINKSGWPIKYKELNNYYNLAGKFLGINNTNHYQFEHWIKTLNLNELSLFDSNIIKPAIAIWAKKTSRFGLGSKYQRLLEDLQNVITYSNATVTELQLNDALNTIINIKAATTNNKKLIIKSKVFILACGALENARLLLVSNKQKNSGIGNENDIVGRYFMEHPKIIKGKVILNKKIYLPTIVGTYFSNGKIKIGFSLHEKVQKERNLLNCYTALEPQVSEDVKKSYAFVIRAMKRLLRKGYSGGRFNKKEKIAEIPNMIYELPPMDLMPHSFYKYYDKLKKILLNNVTDTYVMINYCEQEPDYNSRIVLSNNKDIFGIQKIKLDWKIGSKEAMSVFEIQNSIDHQLKKLDYGFVEDIIDPFETNSFTDASHHMGTTRMSISQSEGVVDSDCKVFSTSNLFVAGSSVFPVSGYANPTLTIAALTIRLADHIKHSFR